MLAETRNVDLAAPLSSLTRATVVESKINPLLVIAAASAKPFGFHPFYPGPGLGGHCIPVDPVYFSSKAKEKVAEDAQLVVDTRHATKGITSSKIVHC